MTALEAALILANHQFGLRSLRERLLAAFGPPAELTVRDGLEGFEAGFVVPSFSESTMRDRGSVVEDR